MDHDPVDAYKRSAPQLLSELARLLSLHNWAEECCIPQEVLGFLDYSWQDLCAGATLLRIRKQTDKRRLPLKLGGAPRKVSTNGKTETGEGSVCPSERQTKVGANPRTKKRKERPSKAAQNFSVASFSLASSSKDEVNGIPQIPEVKQLDPAWMKLHYGIADGSSFIYYPSGCVAVCQSHSALPCGGFYTNVFSDGDCPVILATITAHGHGAVSSSVEAVWSQEAGFISDCYGNKSKEWSWQSDECEEIVIQLSDVISVRLLSGTSAVLSFMCNNETVQLPLPALSHAYQSKEMMVRKVDGLEEPLWRRAGLADRELKKLQQRVQNILDDWLECYRAAFGVKCPDTEQMPDSPLRTRLRREVQSVALPPLNPPEWAVQPEERTSEPQRHLSAQEERPADSSVRLPRSVIIPKSPEAQSAAVTDWSAPPPLTPSAPLTMCPELLRAALLGEGVQRRCSCSVKQMPAVTDVEYDTFVMGQPPHSQQILVVCVTLPRNNTRTVPDEDALEQLYMGRNKHRTMPCTQSQMDSFRLVRYEMSTGGMPSWGCENILLQQRHNAAPGMILMYVRGTLLFVGYTCSRHSFSVGDLQNQISRTRGDYRLGLSLPPDYKFSTAAKKPAAKHTTH
ncbi:FAM194 domain containing protein [Scophthalmus maximus]|uniref:FAM194 domain containing protein n=1 Tax=Scophthalmus maximus TaxID=52904 RepID=A0A2U9BXK6_SCOMX|nr:FAM194 domain containing protein [Scophthalmus maximus]